MKEKLSGSLGFFGGILWYIISFLYGFAPLLILRFPLWADFIIIAVIMFIPFFGELVRLALYVWAFTVVLGQPLDLIVIIFYLCAALYAFTTLLPLAASLFGSKE